MLKVLHTQAKSTPDSSPTSLLIMTMMVTMMVDDADADAEAHADAADDTAADEHAAIPEDEQPLENQDTNMRDFGKVLSIVFKL